MSPDMIPCPSTPTPCSPAFYLLSKYYGVPSISTISILPFPLPVSLVLYASEELNPHYLGLSSNVAS